MDPLIINVALTGMVPQKDQNPHVPVSPAEIIADAQRCVAAGAAIIHVHARHPDGQPAFERALYAEIIGGIRAACPEVLISGSCSGRRFREFSQRAAVLDCRPDFGSLTLGSMNFPTEASVNEPSTIRRLAEAMHERGIVPEWELFDLGMVDYARFLIERGVLSRPFYANLLLGSLGTLAATPFNLVTLVRALPEGTVWSAGGIGRFQFPMNCLAIAMGGHVRTGLEDCLHLDASRSQLATNAGLVERMAGIARSMGRSLATPTEARRLIGLPAAVEPAPGP